MCFFAYLTFFSSFANQTSDLTLIKASANGVISSFSLGIGESVSAGTAAAGIYPDEYMRIEATVTETDLQYFNVGDPVKIELIYLEGGEYAMEGTVEKISRTARPPVKNPAKLPSLSTSSPRKPRNCFMA